ncbi:uncharacterized protein SPAPADRAFT_63189 [Spathaspora passalidarum NRRL Y-27907]|uniref:Uncharacterized protein n=1 Tax=Spathaspora passalidarum (strain NRRL Y-27907 / 11-Y1) TaxID=619300 RepID=G3ATV4_SPAPN|nr:uncharacterized protein SPAPADRAFT_63189 [Spathaspora passalidarum NRRL Y-27907]EGW30330.1 hypothetical protein SPAPADRAFT_63189 [Spathaspora passalidarum NRRL Y-27907]
MSTSLQQLLFLHYQTDRLGEIAFPKLPEFKLLMTRLVSDLTFMLFISKASIVEPIFIFNLEVFKINQYSYFPQT